jgi:glutathione peroxidase-family protein
MRRAGDSGFEVLGFVCNQVRPCNPRSHRCCWADAGGSTVCRRLTTTPQFGGQAPGTSQEEREYAWKKFGKEFPVRG